MRERSAMQHTIVGRKNQIYQPNDQYNQVQIHMEKWERKRCKKKKKDRKENRKGVHTSMHYNERPAHYALMNY